MRRLRQIRKRDGRLAPFRREKIADAIFRAARSVGGEDRFLAEELAGLVVMNLARHAAREVPTVEEVQDVVERVLIETGHARTAKAYILYRERRAALRAARATARGGRPLVGGDGGPDAAAFSKAHLVQALLTTGRLDAAEAEDVARAVEDRILRSGAPRVSDDLVRALVAAELFDRGREGGLPEEPGARVPFELVRGLLVKSARVADPGALAQSLGEEVLAATVLAEILPRAASEAHRMGDLHLYDLGAPLALTATALPLARLLDRHLEGEGIGRLGGARRATAALGEILDRYRPFAARSLGLEDVNVHLAPYLGVLDEDDLAEEVRQWLLSPAVGAFPGRGGRLELEIGLAAEVPAHLAPREPPAPAPPGRPYGRYADEALRTARVLLREAVDLRRRGRRPGPRLTLVLPRRGRRDAAGRALVKEALASAAEVGEPLVVLEESTTPSRGGRWLRRREAEGLDPLRFGDGDVTVATASALNLVAAALRTAARGREAFLREVERLAVLAVEAAAARRDLLARTGDEPGLALWALRRGPVPLVDLDGALHLVEPVGLGRALALVFPGAPCEEQATHAQGVEDLLGQVLAREGEARGLLAGLGSVPGGEAAERLARLDRERFEDAVAWWDPSQAPTYGEPAPPPGEARREALGPPPRRGAPAFQRIRHRVDAEHRPPLDVLLEALDAAAGDARIIEYALEPWPSRWVRTERRGI